MSERSQRAGTEKNAKGKSSPTGSGLLISQQRGGDLAPDPAQKTTEKSERDVNKKRPDKSD